MKQIAVEAKTENLPQVLQMVKDTLSKYMCSEKCKMQIQIAVEEIFVNVASYAYHTDEKPLTVQCEMMEHPLALSIVFMDAGIPYNPLEKAAPCLDASVEERQIGGLGIFMVRQMMDEMTYEYKDGMNILRIRKLISKEG